MEATWSAVINGTPSGALYTNANSSSLSVTGITSVGTYQYRSYITNCSNAYNVTSDVVILTVGSPSTPVAGTLTQPSSCSSPFGSVVLNGLPATGTWTINPGGITGTGTTTTIPNLAAGTYNFTVTVASGCTSPPSASVVIVCISRNI